LHSRHPPIPKKASFFLASSGEEESDSSKSSDNHEEGIGKAEQGEWGFMKVERVIEGADSITESEDTSEL
jgi:hypothetical protein